MPQRKIELATGQVYHVYNRGFLKESIFLHEDDYWRFLQRIELYRKKFDIQVIAWALIPNHFHMLVRAIGVRTPNELNSISSFLLKLQQSHAMYFKYKYSKKGPLFQGRFNAKPVIDDQYLIQLLHYIHRQPSHHDICPDKDWPYTSLSRYMVSSPDSKLLNIDDYYTSFKSFEGLVESGLEFDTLP